MTFRLWRCFRIELEDGMSDLTYFSKATVDVTQLVMVVHLLLKLRIDVKDCEAEHLLFLKLVIQQELCLPPRVEGVDDLFSSSHFNPTA